MIEPGFYNMDCMQAMKEFPDKFFDLAIVDVRSTRFTTKRQRPGWTERQRR